MLMIVMMFRGKFLSLRKSSPTITAIFSPAMEITSRPVPELRNPISLRAVIFFLVTQWLILPFCITTAALIVPSIDRIGEPTMAVIEWQCVAISSRASSQSSRKVVLQRRSNAGVPLTACSAKSTKSAPSHFARSTAAIIFLVLPFISPIV